MSKPMQIKELLPTFFVQLEKRIVDNNKQQSFSFCADCGCYLRPDQGRTVLRDGGPAVLCDACHSKANDDDAQSFEAKYDIH